jgi:hypothetical protein
MEHFVVRYKQTFISKIARVRNFFCFLIYVLVGWPSAAIPILKSDKTPLKTGPISSLEASWIASIMCLGDVLSLFFYLFSHLFYSFILHTGGFVGNFIFGWVNYENQIRFISFFFSYSLDKNYFIVLLISLEDCSKDRKKENITHRFNSSNVKLVVNIFG